MVRSGCFPMTIQKPITLQEAKSIARHFGLTLRKVRSGHYRVNFRDGREHALYAVDLEDAVNAAVEMARKRAAASCKFALWIFLFQEVQKHTTDDPANLGQLSCAQDAQPMSERTHTELHIVRA